MSKVRAGSVTYGANYTYLDATYQSTETINGGSNSSNDGPALQRLPWSFVEAPSDRVAGVT